MSKIVLKTTKIALLLFLFVAVLVFSARVMSPVSAADDSGAGGAGSGGASAAESLGLGTLDQTPGADKWMQSSGLGQNESPLVFFASKMIYLVSIVAGLWIFFNVIIAGYTYITGQGNSSANEKVKNILTQSFIGLLVIVLAYSIGGILGLVFFGDAGFILNPSI